MDIRQAWRMLYRLARLWGYEVLTVECGRQFALMAGDAWPQTYAASYEGVRLALGELEALEAYYQATENAAPRQIAYF